MPAYMIADINMKDPAAYERYKAEHAPRLQAETQKKYGGRFAAFRTLLEVVHTA